MESALSQCCMNYEPHSENRKVTNNEVAKLEQNNPNPFSENTIIQFYIPQNAKEALIKIYSMDGNEIKIIPVIATGSGKVEIAAKTFNPGVYSYLLIIDGKVIDSKQMILSK